jgi:acetyl-CoA acyltransferase
MSSVPMTGFKPELNYDTVKAGHEEYYWGMGNTAEAVAKQFNVSRDDQDEFAYNSHMKALKAQEENQ